MKIPDYNKKIKHPTHLELQEEIKRLKEEYIMLQNASDEVEEEKDKEIERLNNIINEVREWLIEKKETIERFEIYKRKETGAFWYTTLGEIEKYLEILDKENNNGLLI